jgi:hypothetical protein
MSGITLALLAGQANHPTIAGSLTFLVSLMTIE